MIKLIIGKKGAGKTKTLIDLANTASEESKGSVVCIEKGDTLKYDISYKARLVNVDEYGIEGCKALFGFVAGILASNHDVTDIFVDSTLKITGDDKEAFDGFLNELEALISNREVNVTMAASFAVADASATVKKYTK